MYLETQFQAFLVTNKKIVVDYFPLMIYLAHCILLFRILVPSN